VNETLGSSAFNVFATPKVRLNPAISAGSSVRGSGRRSWRIWDSGRLLLVNPLRGFSTFLRKELFPCKTTGNQESIHVNLSINVYLNSGQ